MSIKTKNTLKLYIREDAKANGVRRGFSYWIKLFYGNIPACVFRYLKSLRKYEYYTNIKSPLAYWYRFYNRRLGLKYNLSLPINVIGYGLRIPHIEGGVIVNAKHVGNYCELNSGVLLGWNNHHTEVPIIEDYVRLTPGCMVLGHVKVGCHTVVMPNSVVIHDIPKHSIVAGNPAEIVGTRNQSHFTEMQKT